MHHSVLLHEAVRALHPSTGGVFVDATFGAGGHSRLLAQMIGRKGRLVAFDADKSVFTPDRVAEIETLTQFIPIATNFGNIDKELAKRKLVIDGALFDLGLSSNQLEESGRGFSFQKNEPLLMTFSTKPTARDVTAQKVVNTWSEESLIAILRGFGEERFAKSIARGIINIRKEKKIQSTVDLVEVIRLHTPAWYQRGRTHFATKTFQAIRMAVNEELPSIERGIRGALSCMVHGGRVAVITFHSGEDRLVKQLFRTLATEGAIELVTKKPILPSEEEVKDNPRARSAKLRIAQKQ